MIALTKPLERDEMNMDFTPTVIRDKHDRLMNELKKVIVGQDEFLEHLVIALFTGLSPDG